MELAYIPGITALMVKVCILYYAYKAKHSFAFTALLAVFALHNSAEVMSIVQFNMHFESANFVARAYYAVSMWALVFMLNYANFTVHRRSLSVPIITGLFIYASIFSALLFFTDGIVNDAAALTYLEHVQKRIIENFWVVELEHNRLAHHANIR